MFSKKVLHIVPAAFGEQGIFGGAERYAYNLAFEMGKKTPTRLLAFGKDTKQINNPGGLEEVIVKPFFNVRGQKNNPFSFSVLKHIAWADVVHCHQTHLLCSEFSAFFALLLRKKAFTTDLGGGGWCINRYFSTGKIFKKHLHLSEYSRSVFGQDNWKTADVIYGGVDTGQFAPKTNIQKEPLIVFVGRLMPHKGVDYIIEGLPEGINLEIIGRAYNSDYYSLLQTKAKGRRIKFRTECSDSEIINAYQRARCVVLPSVFRDCYGNQTKVPELLGQTLLEGMACGIPGLTTSVASLPEIIEHNQTGWVVPPNDPDRLRVVIEIIRDHPELCEQMGRRAHSRIKAHFTWEKTINKCFEAYCSS
jgi:glycosyltransferase involved in cell wall biosynthesis